MSKLEELMQLAAGLPDADLEALVGLARRLRVTIAPTVDPELVGLPGWLANAPVDDEPLSDEFKAKLAVAENDVAEGRVTLVPAEEMRRRLLG